jgi:hypothetical protein
MQVVSYGCGLACSGASRVGGREGGGGEALFATNCPYLQLENRASLVVSCGCGGVGASPASLWLRQSKQGKSPPSIMLIRQAECIAFRAD